MMNLIGKKAPEWTATAYLNGDQKTLNSKDFEGKWHAIYWYPLDYTFVCPTEITAFETLHKQFTRQQIIDAVRGEDYPVTDRVVDVQVAGLRKKLGDRGDYIETVRGVGYRLVKHEAADSSGAA